MKYLAALYKHLSDDSLYRNSIYLMLSTGVMAFFGFFFWIINARLFSPEQVGIATTLISVVTLISSFSLLGLSNGLIRYLPTSVNRNKKINTTFLLVSITSLLVGLFYLIFINIFSPKLLFVRENIFFSIFLILFIVFSSLNTLSESIFIAYRSSIYVLIKNIIISVVKLVFPIFLVSFGAYGIFMSVGIATFFATSFAFVTLIFRYGYIFQAIIDKAVLIRIGKFSLGNYIADFIGGIPAMILPIIILNSLGEKFSAYFYMDFMIANLLYIVPTAVSRSLFAEGSYEDLDLNRYFIKSVKLISVIIVPTILITLIFGKYVLLAFGKQYSIEGFNLLQLLAVSGIFISLNSISGTILRVKHKIKQLIILSLIGTILILGFSYIFISKGLFGIGMGWLVGQAIQSTMYLYSVRDFLSTKPTFKASN